MTSSEMLQTIYDDTLDEMYRIQREYGLSELEQRLTDKAKRVLLAPSTEEARVLAGKAISSTSLHCISRGVRKTSEWFEKQAKGCASRAKSYSSRGEAEKAEVQLGYKAKYEQQAEELRATNGVQVNQKRNG